jgi:predicted DNA-binding ArsR family transcriptional regulator
MSYSKSYVELLTEKDGSIHTYSRNVQTLLSNMKDLSGRLQIAATKAEMFDDVNDRLLKILNASFQELSDYADKLEAQGVYIDFEN